MEEVINHISFLGSMLVTLGAKSLHIRNEHKTGKVDSVGFQWQKNRFSWVIQLTEKLPWSILVASAVDLVVLIDGFVAEKLYRLIPAVQLTEQMPMLVPEVPPTVCCTWFCWMVRLAEDSRNTPDGSVDVLSWWGRWWVGTEGNSAPVISK